MTRNKKCAKRLFYFFLNMSKCPGCFHEVLENLLNCPFCGKPLPPKPARWYHKNYPVVVGFILFGPFILPMVWLNPVFSPKKKLFVTLVILSLTYVLFILTKGLLTQYLDIYDQLMNGTKEGTIL